MIPVGISNDADGPMIKISAPKTWVLTNQPSVSNIYDRKYAMYSPFIEPEVIDYFSNKNIERISKKITELLNGVDPDGRRIVVPDDRIRGVLGIWFENRPGNVRDMNDLVIMNIVTQIKDEIEMTTQNNNLSAWVKTYDGDYNILAYSKPKIRHKGPMRMMFHMNY